jgi:hypothetical protein
VDDATARYLVPEFAVVRFESESVVFVAPLMSDQLVPASSDCCHWYATDAPPVAVADTVRFAEA